MTATTDRELIEAVIQTYFESMYESDPAKVHEAFHTDAKITGYMGDQLAQMSVTEFADFVAAQPSAKASGLPAYLETVGLVLAGKTAVAQVRDDYLGNRFFDSLSFLKVDDQWLIYNKLFHVEGPAS